MTSFCDGCGNKLPKRHVAADEKEKQKKIQELLKRRKELERQLSEISHELVRLGHSG